MAKRKRVHKVDEILQEVQKAARVAKPKRKAPANKVVEPWKPSERDMQWYHDARVTCHSYQWVADRAGVTASLVCQICKKVAEWLNAQNHPTIMEHRVQQTQMLDALIYECWKAWRRSIGEYAVETTKEALSEPEGEEGGESLMQVIERTVRKEHLPGDPRFIAEIRSLMEDKRDIWGVDKPVETVVHHTPFDDLLPVGGKSREEAVRDQALAMLARVDPKAAEAARQTAGEPKPG